ncbi:MAG: hypothetical protein HXY47_02345 [Nitrospirae bacterium]|nr:hypothetical protein [Nitrospirota bacterium]
MFIAVMRLSFFKRTLFWDVEIETLSIEKDWFFIIERVLEFGDIKDLKCLVLTFSKDQIQSVIKNSRILSPRTISFCNAIGYAS